MSTRIHILPDTVVDKIAAGEVVERPASVVKELVENALDAGARSVEIRLRNGGRDLIEVVDDGCGMNARDARLAVKRHATSKISALEDLESLESFGFRGEALPSIAAVSRLTLETSDGSVPEGSRLLVEGGVVKGEEPAARQAGTTVRVEHLFANVPARRKFLKSAQTEYRHVLRTVVEAALSRLDTGFRLEHDGRESLRLGPDQQLRERAEVLFGKKALSGAVLLAAEVEDLHILGLLGAPAAARRSSSAVHLFVNGRPISHRGLSYGLYTGYGELLPAGRYPLACLFLEVSPRNVDINVHPAKREVRFEEEARIRDMVITSVREALSRELGARPLSLRVREGDPPWHDRGLATRLSPEAKAAASDLFAVAKGDEAGGGVNAVEGWVVDAVIIEERSLDEETMIWKDHDRYLIAQIKGGVLVVDQHAAHERILYEQALAQLSGEPAVRQQLLFPRLLDLSAEQYALVEEVGPLLERVGFDVRPFGGTTMALQAVPPLLERVGREEEVFLALLDDLAERGVRGSGVQEKIAASLACRAAVRFGQRLDPEERRSLVDQLFACSQPQICPHGRPTHLVLSLEELDNLFHR